MLTKGSRGPGTTYAFTCYALRSCRLAETWNFEDSSRGSSSLSRDTFFPRLPALPSTAIYWPAGLRWPLHCGVPRTILGPTLSEELLKSQDICQRIPLITGSMDAFLLSLPRTVGFQSSIQRKIMYVQAAREQHNPTDKIPSRKCARRKVDS